MRLVKIGGNMDAGAMAAMRPMFEELAESPDDVCLDLHAVDQLDSSGVGAIVFVFKRLRERSIRFAIVNACGQPLRTIRALGLEQLLSTVAPPNA